MNHSGDAAEQVLRMSLDGVEYVIKIAGAGAKNLAAAIFAAMKSKKTSPTSIRVSGQERMKRMLKSGQPLDVFPVREKDIRAFMQDAKKYGIVYCAVRDKQPRADGMVDVLVRKEDSPKINRVMDRLQYGEMDTATIKSEVAKTRAEKGHEPSVPDKSDNLDVDSFLDDIMPDEGKSKEGQNQAAQKPVPQQSQPKGKQEVQPETFFSNPRTKQNPSGRGSSSTINQEKRTSDAPSVKGEIDQIRAELKKNPRKREQEAQRGKGRGQQYPQHRQPQRKPKSKKEKER